MPRTQREETACCLSGCESVPAFPTRARWSVSPGSPRREFRRTRRAARAAHRRRLPPIQTIRRKRKRTGKPSSPAPPRLTTVPRDPRQRDVDGRAGRRRVAGHRPGADTTGWGTAGRPPIPGRVGNVGNGGTVSIRQRRDGDRRGKLRQRRRRGRRGPGARNRAHRSIASDRRAQTPPLRDVDAPRRIVPDRRHNLPPLRCSRAPPERPQIVTLGAVPPRQPPKRDISPNPDGSGDFCHTAERLVSDRPWEHDPRAEDHVESHRARRGNRGGGRGTGDRHRDVADDPSRRPADESRGPRCPLA